MKKKDWTEPGLIVLVRNKPEEAVLIACKSLGLMNGNMHIDQLCANGACNYCHDTGAS